MKARQASWIGCLLTAVGIVLPAPQPGAQAQDAAEFDSVTGYRIARYQAPVPEEVPGAKRIHFEDVERILKRENAVLVDVMAADGAVVDPANGQWRLLKPRRHIPGSHWLANVGRGRLDPALDSYFRSNLDRLTGGDKARAVIIYCLADCWMGWNAAKRAASYGYTAIHWYPEGSDGWRDWDGTLADGEPVPMEPQDARMHRASKLREAD